MSNHSSTKDCVTMYDDSSTFTHEVHMFCRSQNSEQPQLLFVFLICSIENLDLCWTRCSKQQRNLEQKSVHILDTSIKGKQTQSGA